METEVKCLEDEVMTLTTAIEVAIIKGQKSLGLLSDIPDRGVVLDEGFALTCVRPCPRVVGWVDDF